MAWEGEEKLFKALVWIQFVRALLSFRNPVGIKTYGRHLAVGLQKTLTLPSQPAWVLMEFPALLVPALVFLRGRHRGETVPLVLLVLFLAHYFQRTVIYPLRISGTATRMPVITALLGALFNALNTYIQTRWISHFGEYPEGWLRSPQFGVGSFVFLMGMLINVWADSVLISLRSSSPRGEYKVPRGGLYEYISCPNYFGEIVEWLGWAILSFSAAGFGFFLYTFATLAPRAAAHHAWYRKKFEHYPAQRRALVPFVY